MRIILGMLITTVAGVGMGYWAGYSNGVAAEVGHRGAVVGREYFDDYYAEPATRPVVNAGAVDRKAGNPRRTHGTSSVGVLER